MICFNRPSPSLGVRQKKSKNISEGKEKCERS